MIELILKIAPEFLRCEEAPIIFDGENIGWHYTILDNKLVALSGGCSVIKENARRIAVAELVERYVFKECLNNNLKDLCLSENPSTCGFAAGFESHPTMLRAVAEAVERWAWSMWIDRGLPMVDATIDKKFLSPISKFFQSQFIDVQLFSRDLSVDVFGQEMNLRLAVVLAFTEQGVFPGSRVCSRIEDPWEHALTEAWRHWHASSVAKPERAKGDLFLQRVMYFSTNKHAALNQITKTRGLNTFWPKPCLKLLKKVPDVPPGTHVWRALCDDYVGWHEGDNTRFVY